MTRKSILVAALLLVGACDDAFVPTPPVMLVAGALSAGSWTDTLQLLDTLTVHLPLEDAAGNEVTGPAITYVSGAPDVIAVVPSEAGALLLALSVGTSTITASVEDPRFDVADFSHAITVEPLSVSWPDTLNVTNTDTVRVTLGPRYAGGPLAWSSSNEGAFRVTVDTSAAPLGTVALVEGVGTGQGNVVVAAGGGVLPVAEVSLPIRIHQKWSSVSAGMTHTCALTVSNVPYCWGSNEYGQLGDGSFTSRDRPTEVATALKFEEIQAGGVATGSSPPEAHSCGRLGPQVLCWGSNQSNQLDDGAGSCYDPYNPQFCYRPLPIRAPDATAPSGIVRLTVGGRHTCVLRLTEPAPLCWGMADNIGDTPSISFVGRAGGQHVCFVGIGVLGSALGTQCGGLNDAGQLGDGTTTNRLANDLGGFVRPGGVDWFTLSVGGGKHTCTLDLGVTPRALWCWGSNTAGQLGPNGPGPGMSECPAGPCSRVPVTVPVTVDIADEGLTLGGQHTCILSTDGDAYCWGDDSAGQLGDGGAGGSRSTLQPAAPGIRFSVVSAGDTHTCGVSLSGSLYCWGANGGSLLGGVSGTDGSAPVRVFEPVAN